MESTAGEGRSATFLGSRLASVLAVAPLGVWTIAHVWHNLSVFKSPEEWQVDVTGYHQPAALVITSIVVLAPLLLHAIWGLGRLRTSRPNNIHYSYFSNLTYLLQRISAVGVLAFLGAHIWLAFLRPRFLQHQAEPFSDIASEMRHDPATLVVYLLGTLGVAYHLGNGLYSFAMGWGLGASRRSLRGFQIASILLFIAMLAMSWGVVYGLYTAGAQFSAPID